MLIEYTQHDTSDHVLGQIHISVAPLQATVATGAGVEMDRVRQDGPGGGCPRRRGGVRLMADADARERSTPIRILMSATGQEVDRRHCEVRSALYDAAADDHRAVVEGDRFGPTFRV